MNYIKFSLKSLGIWVHTLSKWMPKVSNKWVFGSYFAFADNAKYLFYTIYDSHPEINAIWITHNYSEVSKLRRKGFKVFYWLSPMGIYHCLTAKVYVSTASVADINGYTSGGAFFVNLWHGVGVKKVRWLAPEIFMEKYHLSSVEQMHSSLRFKIETFPYLFRKPDLCLVPSHFQAETFFVPMMQIPFSQCLLGNYPRNEILLWERERIINLVHRYESQETLILITKLKDYEKIYIYMPTWRNDDCDFISASGIRWKELDGALKHTNSLLILKMHPHTRLDLRFIEECGNIVNFPQECDVYTILPFTDCLITDYSSIYSDYSLMAKEIILFVFDYQDYIRNSYSLEEYGKYYPGVRAYNFQELLHLIKNNVDCHVPQKEHDFIMKTYWDDAFNGVNIVDEIKKQIGLS